MLPADGGWRMAGGGWLAASACRLAIGGTGTCELGTGNWKPETGNWNSDFQLPRIQSHSNHGIHMHGVEPVDFFVRRNPSCGRQRPRRSLAK
jgi:hypothetical protein